MERDVKIKMERLFDKVNVKNYKIKICARCGEKFKPNSGKQKYCEECIPIVRRERMREINRNWRQRNLDKARELVKNWQQRNPKKMREDTKNWRKEHSDKVREMAKKHHNKRHRNLDFIPLNKSFRGADAHHIDRIYVIYIPKEVHQSIRHSVLQNKNMDEINAEVFNYLKN